MRRKEVETKISFITFQSSSFSPLSYRNRRLKQFRSAVSYFWRTARRVCGGFSFIKNVQHSDKIFEWNNFASLQRHISTVYFPRPTVYSKTMEISSIFFYNKVNADEPVKTARSPDIASHYHTDTKGVEISKCK